MTDWNEVDRSLKKANRLLGNRRFYNWPTGPRLSWPANVRKARELRESALSQVVQSLKKRKPHLQQYELIPKNTKYDPEFFRKHRYQRARGASFGWSGAPTNLPKRQRDALKPLVKLNDTAFTNIKTLASTLRHEVSHRIQDEHRSTYYGYNRRIGVEDGGVLRRFDARLRDLENRNGVFPFQLTPSDKWLAAVQLDNAFTKLRRNSHWNRLWNGNQPGLGRTKPERKQAGRIFCNNLLDRYHRVRKATWNEMTRKVLPGSTGWVPPIQRYRRPQQSIHWQGLTTLDVLRQHLDRHF